MRDAGRRLLVAVGVATLLVYAAAVSLGYRLLAALWPGEIDGYERWGRRDASVSAKLLVS